MMSAPVAARLYVSIKPYLAHYIFALRQKSRDNTIIKLPANMLEISDCWNQQNKVNSIGYLKP